MVAGERLWKDEIYCAFEDRPHNVEASLLIRQSTVIKGRTNDRGSPAALVELVVISPSSRITTLGKTIVHLQTTPSKQHMLVLPFLCSFC